MGPPQGICTKADFFILSVPFLFFEVKSFVRVRVRVMYMTPLPMCRVVGRGSKGLWSVLPGMLVVQLH